LPHNAFRRPLARSNPSSHVVKRAQGGSDFDLDQLIALCPSCHAQTDAPYARGRLVITPLGDGRFSGEVIRGIDKWAIRA
jgi:5-methylcytosine-specific restriction endonuclease McrA